MEDPIDDKDMNVDRDAYRHVKRDWVTLLAPSIIAAILSTCSSVAVCAYYMGSMNQRVLVLEDFKTHIASDYMPKDQIMQYMEQQEKQAERISHTLDRIEDRQEKAIDNGRH